MPIKEYPCSCANLPQGFKLEEAWIVGGGWVIKNDARLNQCIQNGWLETIKDIKE